MGIDLRYDPKWGSATRDCRTSQDHIEDAIGFDLLPSSGKTNLFGQTTGNFKRQFKAIMTISKMARKFSSSRYFQKVGISDRQKLHSIG